MLYRIATGGEIFAPLGGVRDPDAAGPLGGQERVRGRPVHARGELDLPSGAPVMQEPLVADNDVYVGERGGLLTSRRRQTGTQRWSTSTHGGRLIAVSAKRIYLESHDERPVHRRSRHGTDRGRSPARPRSVPGCNLRAYDLGLTNNLNDRLYLATQSGLVIGLREIGQLQPRPLRDPKAKPFGNIPPEGALPSLRHGHSSSATPATEAAPAREPGPRTPPRPHQRSP